VITGRQLGRNPLGVPTALGLQKVGNVRGETRAGASRGEKVMYQERTQRGGKSAGRLQSQTATNCGLKITLQRKAPPNCQNYEPGCSAAGTARNGTQNSE